MLEKTVLIDLNALVDNVKYFKSLSSQKAIFVAKSNCYGCGLNQIARSVAPYVDWFAVISVKDAIKIRRLGIDKPVLVMSPFDIKETKWLIDFDLTQAILSFDDAYALELAAKKLGVIINTHLKIDTGMNRLGVKFDGENYEDILKVFNLKNLSINGLYTHFCCADEKYNPQNLYQYKRFLSVKEYLLKRCVKIGLTHAANTYGLLNLPFVREDAFRIGMGAYGVIDGFNKLPLKPVLKLSAPIIQINDLEPHDCIGYGAIKPKNTTRRVAVLPIGYYDGVLQFIKPFYVKLNGYNAQVVGRVCMNHIFIDVTNIPCKLGDTVIFFDTADEMNNYASAQGISVYQVLCLVGQNARRKYIGKIST